MIAKPLVMPERVSVAVSAEDPISRDGVLMQLRGQPGFALVDEADVEPETVVVVVCDEVDGAALQRIRAVRRREARVVLVAGRVDDQTLLTAVEAGVGGVVRRSQVTPSALAGAIRSAAAGDGTLPPDLLGRLLDQVGRLQRQVLSPLGLTVAGLTERELKVLRLLAEGLDTAEVGRRLYFSERTVKAIIHDLTSRLQLRNRTHAVAYALREGLI
jgi:DNA-binding NarL/FixJ family response regulator